MSSFYFFLFIFRNSIKFLLNILLSFNGKALSISRFLFINKSYDSYEIFNPKEYNDTHGSNKLAGKLPWRKRDIEICSEIGTFLPFSAYAYRDNNAISLNCWILKETFIFKTPECDGYLFSINRPY